MNTPLADRLVSLHREIAETCTRAGRNPDAVRLIAVTKTHPAPVLQAVIDAGHRDIGENRVQEIVEKVPLLHGERTVHLIGHLQSNKVNKVVPLVDWIHSIDSEGLAVKVDGACGTGGKKMKVLVQVNTSGEESKSGCRPEEAVRLCEKVAGMANLEFRGLMTIGLLGGTEQQTRKCFQMVRAIGEHCRQFTDASFQLSMGMTDDFRIAIEEGSTMVRIGSYLFGTRSV
jgi:hypothetical protein